MPITEQQLLQILPNAGPRAGVFVGALNRGMTRFGITSPVRVAAFLAQNTCACGSTAWRGSGP